MLQDLQRYCKITHCGIKIININFISQNYLIINKDLKIKISNQVPRILCGEKWCKTPKPQMKFSILTSIKLKIIINMYFGENKIRLHSYSILVLQKFCRWVHFQLIQYLAWFYPSSIYQVSDAIKIITTTSLDSLNRISKTVVRNNAHSVWKYTGSRLNPTILQFILFMLRANEKGLLDSLWIYSYIYELLIVLVVRVCKDWNSESHIIFSFDEANRFCIIFLYLVIHLLLVEYTPHYPPVRGYINPKKWLNFSN